MKLLILSLCVLASSLALVSGQDGMDPYEVPSVQVQETDRQEPKSVEQDQEPEGLERAAAFGHSPIAAGKQPQEEKKPSAKFGPSAVPPPYFQLQGGIPNLISIDPVPQFDQDPKQRQGQVPPSPQPGGQYSPHQNPGSPSFPPNFPVPFDNVDPIKGLAFLEYIRFLLEVYPLAVDEKPKCDLTKFGKCTCVNPPEFTQDGRGNCNLGVTKPDTQVWCYVNPKFGHPVEVCPDARPSKSRPGYYWSRFACITE